MATKVAISTLNARSIDIINVIRANASYEYQQSVPQIADVSDIPAVGEKLAGYPALANEFMNALINRIALVDIKSATFNNEFAALKKGYLEYGETVEEAFVNITKAKVYDPEKAKNVELARHLPDVRTAFHTINWRVYYPVTVQAEDIKLAFLSAEGVTNLIAKIVGQVTTAAEYDEFLLFKYLMIKAITHGKVKAIPVDKSDIKNAAVAFRATSNKFKFLSTQYNEAKVLNNAPRERQYIFMDSDFDASYDVNVLASAFNMDKAEYVGKRHLVDSWTEFDNDRFDQIRAENPGLEAVTANELAAMSDVIGVLASDEWFQVYDNLINMESVRVAAGMYYNYFMHQWKTISSSPFSNAVVFVDATADTTLPDTLTLKVTDKSVSKTATILTLTLDDSDATLESRAINFVQTGACVTAGVAVHKYGAIIYPKNASAQYVEFTVGDVMYKSTSTVGTTAAVNDKVTCARVDAVDNTLSALSITDVTLTPAFAKATTTYTGATTSATGTLTATKSDSDATMVVKMNGTVVEGTTLNFESGAGNVLKIDVTGVVEGSVATKTYTVTITRS